MLKYPLISVLIPNYNLGHIIQDNFNGLLSQSYKNWEVIVVDDGSTDNSKEIILKYAEKDSRFKPIFLPKNVGVQGAVRKGMEQLSGELFFMYGSDDFIVNADFFQRCVQEFHDRPGLGVAFFKTRIINSEDNKYMCDIGYAPRSYLTGAESSRFFFHRIFLIPGSSSLIPVKLLRSIGNHEDLGPQHDQFLIHAAASTGGAVFISEVGAVMRYSPSTYGAKTEFIEYIERHARMERYFRNLLTLLNDNLDEKIFKNWRESIINDEKGRMGDFDKLAQSVDHFFSNLTIEHLTLFKQIIVDYKPKLDEFVKTVNHEVAEKRKIAHEIFDNIAGKIE